MRQVVDSLSSKHSQTSSSPTEPARPSVLDVISLDIKVFGKKQLQLKWFLRHIWRDFTVNWIFLFPKCLSAQVAKKSFYLELPLWYYDKKHKEDVTDLTRKQMNSNKHSSRTKMSVVFSTTSCFPTGQTVQSGVPSAAVWSRKSSVSTSPDPNIIKLLDFPLSPSSSSTWSFAWIWYHWITLLRLSLCFSLPQIHCNVGEELAVQSL